MSFYSHLSFVAKKDNFAKKIKRNVLKRTKCTICVHCGTASNEWVSILNNFINKQFY